MKKLITLSVLTLALQTASFAADYTASLDGAQDGGAGRTGTGLGTFTLTGTDLSYSVSYSGLSGNSTAAHIHGPAPVGVPAGVLFPLSGTLGGTSGTLSGTINNLTAQNISDLNSGLWYVNIHSSPNFGGGEIRGQITTVPEPSSVALLMTAAGLGLALRRKKA